MVLNKGMLIVVQNTDEDLGCIDVSGDRPSVRHACHGHSDETWLKKDT